MAVKWGSSSGSERKLKLEWKRMERPRLEQQGIEQVRRDWAGRCKLLRSLVGSSAAVSALRLISKET